MYHYLESIMDETNPNAERNERRRDHRQAWPPLPQTACMGKYPQHPSIKRVANPLQYIQSTCATSGDGLYEGLEWLSNSLRKAGHQ